MSSKLPLAHVRGGEGIGVTGALHMIPLSLSDAPDLASSQKQSSLYG